MLPTVDTDEQWDVVVPDEAVMRPGVEDLCARLGLAGVPLDRFTEGTQPVYAVGDDLVLKLFPGAAADDGLVEERVLSHLQGRLPVPTPRVHASGTYENGWRYVLMSRLPGEDLAVAWPRIPRADRERLVTEAGEALAALHALDPGPLADVLGPGDWGDFLGRQRAGAVRRQRECGLPESWLEQIPGFLDSVPLRADAPRVLLHTEFMRQHLLVGPAGSAGPPGPAGPAGPAGRLGLTGLFDFEPAMIGDRAYDFVGVGLFVTRAEPGLLSRFTRAYGRTFEPRELLAHTLLHVYSNLPWYLRELPAPPEPTLDALAQAWFGHDRPQPTGIKVR
ncbi:aminoglycoside phosphotransferase family protein [Streptomyces sp. NPDC055243]|uniref:aminoglycoside phosphotransferase family protein n=1 Tax=Streptomyces sp. NPDC055243 TaxID=3365720 RepID=UPI0037D2A4A9